LATTPLAKHLASDVAVIDLPEDLPGSRYHVFVEPPSKLRQGPEASASAEEAAEALDAALSAIPSPGLGTARTSKPELRRCCSIQETVNLARDVHTAKLQNLESNSDAITTDVIVA